MVDWFVMGDQSAINQFKGDKDTPDPAGSGWRKPMVNLALAAWQWLAARRVPVHSYQFVHHHPGGHVAKSYN